MLIGMAEKERRTAARAQDKSSQTAQVDRWRHQQAAQKWRCREMRNHAEGIGRLVPGEDEINRIDEEACPGGGFQKIPQGAAAPPAALDFLAGHFRQRTPSQAERYG